MAKKWFATICHDFELHMAMINSHVHLRNKGCLRFCSDFRQFRQTDSWVSFFEGTISNLCALYMSALPGWKRYSEGSATSMLLATQAWNWTCACPGTSIGRKKVPPSTATVILPRFHDPGQVSFPDKHGKTRQCTQILGTLDMQPKFGYKCAIH